MKLTRRITALFLCLLMLGSMLVYAVGENGLPCENCGQTGEHAEGCVFGLETCAECSAIGGHAETCSLYVAPVVPACTCGTETEEHAVECALYVAPAPVCTCGTETEEHAVECPLYVEPAPVCTCGTETEEHAVECPLYVEAAPEVCTECGAEEGHAETCSQYEILAMQPEPATLFDKLMECESAEEMFELMNENIDAVWKLTFEEVEALRARVAELEPEVYEEYLTGKSGNESYAMEVLFVLEAVQANCECPDCGLTGEHTEDCPWEMGDAFVITGMGPFPSNGVLVNGTTYKLTDNVRLNPNNLKVPAGAAVTIDLNGMVLVGIGTGYVITVEEGASLTIKDSNPTVGHNGNITDKGLWEWAAGNYASQSKGGFITNKGTGKGIMVNGGTVTMTGGTIAGCYTKGIGAAVTATSTGTFIMTGGRIMYNVTESDDSDSRGGAIYGEPAHGNTGSYIEITNAQIFGNTTSGDGGAICGYIVTLKNTTVSDNTSLNGKGGGIYVRHANATDPVGRLTIDNCQITNNMAKGNGGGICADTGTVTTISNGSSIDGNTTSAYGGGIYAANLTITGTSAKKISVSNNDALSTYGGGIFVNKNCTITHAKIDNNYATTLGGGIHSSCNIAITDSDITNNCAMATESGGVNQGRGGGINVMGEGVTCTLTRTNVTGNTAMYYGGGVQVRAAATLELVSGKISNNTAIIGGAGGVHVSDAGTLTMTGGEISDNVANSVGGGIHSSYSCTLNLIGGAIKGNVVYGRGGGVHVNTGGNLALQGVEISGNKAWNGTNLPKIVSVDRENRTWKVEGYDNNKIIPGYGGGVLINAGTCSLSAGTLSNNFAETGGGGIAFIMSGLSSEENNTYWEYYRVVTFTQTGGVISGNSTNGNGGAIYLMRNMLSKEELGDTAEQFLNGTPMVTASSGTVIGNSARGNGGAVYQENGTKFIISGDAEFSGNTSQKSGGAVYIAEGTAEINGGTISGNEAKENGGALYISGNVTMTNGTIGGSSNNDANSAVNGGALYVTDGNFSMSSGSITHNTATGNGGALYMDGGNVTIEHGTINENKATGTTEKTGNGGAIYMASGVATLKMESGTMSSNEAANDGGAIYAEGGTMHIGLQGCSGDTECALHTAKGTGRHHPVVSNNKAGDAGGGIALSDGSVYFYCGNAKDNQALYQGVGKNVFMDGGEFHLYDGADVGVPRDPDLVIVGGKLHNECVNKEYLYLNYYSQNTETVTEMQGLAEYGEIMNLPDGEYFWEAPEGMVFLGWTAQGAASGNQSNEYVRNKEQYVNSGGAIEILDGTTTGTDQTAVNTNRLFDGTDDKVLHLYALWAPETSSITYVNGLTGETIPNTDADPDTYTFSRKSNQIAIQPVKHAGYDLVGWYIYQKGDQNANWNNTLTDTSYEPVASGEQPFYLELATRNGALSLEAGNTNFGDIVMIANFEPAYTDLTIDKTGSNETKDAGATYIYKIYGVPLNANFKPFTMQVIVPNNGEVTIKDLPVGTYTITEQENWSWRYEVESITVTNATATSTDNANGVIVVDILDSAKAVTVTYTNGRQNNYWLDDYDYEVKN